MPEILGALNTWLLAFTLSGLFIGTWLFRWYVPYPLLGGWYLWTLCVWWVIMGYDQVSVYFGWDQWSVEPAMLDYLWNSYGIDPRILACNPLYPWYVPSRVSLSRFGIFWGIYFCHFYGFMRFHHLRFRDLAKPLRIKEPPDERGNEP